MDDQYYRKAPSRFKLPPTIRKALKNKSFMLALMIAVPVFSFVLFSNRGVIKRMSLESEKRMMEERILEVQKEQLRLQRLSRALDNDMRAIEKVAREKYGMIREGEVVYKVRKE